MAGTVRELQARFTATMGGMRSAIRTVQRDIQGISGVTSRTVRDSNREFQRLETKLEMLPDHLKGFGKELHNTRKEMKDAFKHGTRSLDEMSTAATKSSVALNKITSVTKTGKSAIKTVQGLGEATRETQLAILGLNRDGTVKISTEETTHRLAKFKDELADSKRQLEALRDAGDFASYEAGMRVVEKKLKDVDRAMFAAAKGGQAYTDMITRLGIHTSDTANQMAIRMEAYKDQFIRSVDLMNARSNQSKKMMDILPETSMFQTADRFFLGIGNRLEDIAKKGSAANIALRMLGRNASMKDLNDRIMLINQGLMRMNMLGLGMGIAFAGFTTSMIGLSNAVDGRLVPAADEFKKTWLDALTPFAQIWTDFALMVVKAGTSVGEFVQKINELNPAISESIGMFAFLFTGLSVILSPMAIGIGRAEGMRAAFSSLFLIIKPFVLGFLRIAATASIVSGALVLVGGVFIKLWKNSENLRAAMMSLWDTLKEAGATIAEPFVKAFKMIGDEVTKLLNKMVGSDAQNMASFWQTIGDKIAVGVNKIRDAIKPVADKIADVVDAFVEWEGFSPVIAGLTAAFVTYRTTVAGVALAVKALNLIQKASVATMALMRGAMIAYTLAGGGLQGVLAVVTAAQRALNLSMMMNPVGLIIAALVGLGVAFVVAYKKSETFRNFVNKLWAAIKTGASFVLNWLKTNWPMLLAIITGPIGLIVYAVIKHWDAIKNATITAFNAVKNFFSDFFTKMKIMFNLHVALFLNNFNMLKTGLINIATRIRDSVVNFFTDLWTKAKIMFNLHVALLINNFNMLKTGLVNIVTRIRDSIVNFFTDLWNKIKIMFNLHVALLINNFNILKNNLINIALNIRDRIVSFFNDLWTKIKNIFNNIKTFLTNVWNGIKTSVSGIVQSIVSSIKKSWDDVKTRTSSVFNAIKQFLSDVWNGIKNTVSKLANSAKDSVVNAWNTLKNRTTEMFNSIKSKVTSIFDDIVGAAKKLPGRIGDGIKSMASGVKKGVTSFANTLVKAMGKGLNGTITGINWVLEKVGAPTIKKWEVPKYAKGTGNGKHGGGLAWLGDGGEHELYRTPKGQVGLSPNTDTLMNLPKGTEVLSGKQTKQAFATANVPMYDKGSGVIDGIKKGASWVADKGQEVYEHAKDKTVETAGKVKDLALDVWDYMDDPAALMKKVFGKFIPDLPNLAGAAGDMLKGGVKTVKDKSIDFIKSKLDEYMSFDDSGGDGSTVGPGSGYGGMHPYVEAWYKKVKDKFGPTKFMGGYSNRNMVGGKSKSMHAYGRAFDIGGSGATMSKIAEYLRTQAKNIQYVIYNHRSSKMGGAWKPYGGGGKNPHTDHVHADFLPGGGGGGKTGSVKGVQGWIPYIKKAAAQMKVAINDYDIQGILAQIKRESTGNEKITQSSAVRDINTRNGNPARGLLQYIPQTFRAYAMKGHNNIYSGYDQLLAWFNNSNWRKDNPRGRSGWGPSGKRRYKNGTDGHFGGDAIMGDGNKREPFLLPNGLMGLSPAISTLFRDLPKGTVVWKSVEDFMGQLNNGASSILGSNMPSVDLSGISSASVGSTTTNNYTLKDIQNALTVDVNVQMGDVIMDGRKVAQVTSPYIKKELVNDMKRDSYKRGMK
ncbi:D-Ala-D-Ala carboxypeptidase family metallohydrolase [Priestia megaterium]